MKNFTLFLVSLLIFSLALPAQIVYEDFEDMPLEWNPFGDGVYNGAVENPDSNAINGSPMVGSYTKSNEHSYSLLIAFVDPAMDLTVNNQFSIDVYSPTASQILFKIEGDGEALESIKNIANTNVWQRYTFDMSGAANFTTITKIIIFFDPGVTESDDTYLFDNIVANPAGACAGTVADLAIIDDFECQRNASYGAGWDAIEAIDNPDASGINTSSSVGKYTEAPGAWAALVIDHHNPIDLSTNNVVKTKIWAPKVGRMLFKLEGGVSPVAEIFIDVTEVNTWVEYTADFGAQAAANHKKLVLFFNAGIEPEEGDLYYIDDITWNQAPPIAGLEEFEDGANLTWEPLNGDATNHGTFNGVVANPDKEGVNSSDNIGSYTKGGAAFSTVSAFLLAGLDLSANPQLNLQVWAPAGSQTVTMQLASPIQGNKEVTRELPATGEWVQLEFNFEEFKDVTDFERVNLLFDGGTAAPGATYFFDNLLQGSSTVDPCEGVESVANILDDYECQRNVTYGAGENSITAVANPDVSPENASLSVGEYKDPLDEWSALGFESGGSIDLSLFNQFSVKIWSPTVVPLLFKLEGGSSPAKEIFVDVTAAGQWQNYTVDFSDQAGEDHARIVVFFNAGMLPSQEDTYYIDNVEWRRSGYTGCIGDNETTNTTISNFVNFANGYLESEGGGIVLADNPNKSGINTSDKVIQFIKAFDAQPWAGGFADLGAAIDFKGNKTLRVKVLMDHIGNFAAKLEGSTTGAPNIELSVPNTLINEWEELTIDFSEAPDDGQYTRLTIFVDLAIDPAAEDVTSWFDDIVIGEGDCAALGTGIFSPTIVEKFQVSPNPVQDLLFVELTNTEVARLEIYSLLGQRMQSIPFNNSERTTIEVQDLQQGVYVIAGYNKAGMMIANAKFVKE